MCSIIFHMIENEQSPHSCVNAQNDSPLRLITHFVQADLHSIIIMFARGMLDV